MSADICKIFIFVDINYFTNASKLVSIVAFSFIVIPSITFLIVLILFLKSKFFFYSFIFFIYDIYYILYSLCHISCYFTPF